ncbi:MAG: helix-turn-helix transcriptional regulator [Phycisphaerales bacterium]
MDTLVPFGAAEERQRLCDPALHGGRAQFVALCNGRRCLVHAVPLDDAAFGTAGVLMVMSPALSRSEGRGVPCAHVPEMGNRLGRLSRAELAVAYLFASGLTTEAIGDRLNRSEHTVNDHMKSIHRKLGISRQVELVTLLAFAGIAGFTEAEWCAMTGVTIPHPSHEPAGAPV